MNLLEQRRRLVLGKKSILPSGYKLCEYLESTGTQYIDTGVIPTANTGYEIKISVPNILPDKIYFGARMTSGDTRYTLGVYNGYVYYGFGKTFADTINWRPNNNEFFVIDFNFTTKNTGYYNGAYPRVANTSISGFTKTNLLFGQHSYTSATAVNLNACRIAYVKFADRQNLIHEFIPCLDNNNRPCMYDTVSKQTFYNQGTGEFLYGNIMGGGVNLDDFTLGFVNGTTGVIEHNSIVPYSIVSPFITVKQGQPLVIDSDLDTIETNAGFRIRMFDVGDTYIGQLSQTEYLQNKYGTLTFNKELYTSTHYTFIPNKDYKVRLMYLDNRLLSYANIRY